MRSKIFYLLLLFYPLMLGAQEYKSVSGTVYGLENGEPVPLPGANVHWLGTTRGTTTGIDGNFSISRPVPGTDLLVISFVGYHADTIEVGTQSRLEVILKSAIDLEAVEVIGRESSTRNVILNPIQTAVITEKELQKAACCNLSESFETTATVDVMYSDAVTGTKEIRMLGLDGVYTSFFIENMPYVRGLSLAQGITFLPGTWIENIMISKGTGSVTTSYEPIAGQINLELRQPDDTDKLYVNIFGDNTGRGEANIHYSNRFNERLSTVILTHGSFLQTRKDHSHDYFMDMPLFTRYSVLNRWKYEIPEKMILQAGASIMKEERIGGSMNFDPGIHLGSHQVYGVSMDMHRVDAFIKSGFMLPGNPFRSIGLIMNTSNYRQDDFYGVNKYDGNHSNLNASLVYQDIIGHSFHRLTAGLALNMDQISEHYNEIILDRQEVVPGIFGEYTFDDSEKWNLIAGLRADHHNEFGFFLTPRVNIRYCILPETTIRLAAGRGFRTPALFANNTAYLLSSRQVVVEEEIMPERAWNAGASVAGNFILNSREGNFTVDFYRTQFQNQLVTDLDKSVDKIHFYNLRGESFSNSMQVEVNYEVFNRFDFRIAYKLDDVKTTYDGELMQMPLVARHKGLVNLAYSLPADKWRFDLTTQFNGSQRLPDTSENPVEFRKEEFAPGFIILNSHVTRKFGNLDLYIGGENLTNFRQADPILAPKDPFGPFFDASMIWGPVHGRKIYFGLRYNI